MLEDTVIVGSVGAPYGVRGWVHIKSFTQPPDNLLHYRPWLLRAGGLWRECDPTQVRVHGSGLVALFAGIADREAAAAVTGNEIGVARSALPEPGADEYYWGDLQGLTVIDQAGRSLGRVARLMDIGAHVVLVVVDDDAETLIPFVAKHVTEVDLAQGRVEVDWDEPD